MSIYFTLFWEFFKTGLFAIGGGMATLPFLSSMAERFPWLTQEQLANMIAVSESTPGPLGINCATYAGYNAAGVPGAIIASFSEVLPSYIIILIISKMLRRFSQSKYVSFAFGGNRAYSRGSMGSCVHSAVQFFRVCFGRNSGGIQYRRGGGFRAHDGIDQYKAAQKAASALLYRFCGGIGDSV